MGNFLKRLRGAAGHLEPEAKLARDAGDFWGGAESSQIRDYSHWRGEGRWGDARRWEEIGETHHRLFERLLRLSGRAAPVLSLIEWGPGGGANAVRFAPEIDRFIGVDISRANLDECGRRLAEAGFTSFTPVLIDPLRPEAALDGLSGSADFFLSTAVYQHFPGKEYGERVTRVAARLLGDDGIALIQVRYDDGSDKFAPKLRDYFKNAIHFTSYRIDEFWEVLARSGFKPLAIELDPAVRYAYYHAKKGDAHG